MFSVRHSGTRFVRDSLQQAGLDIDFGRGLEHLNFVDYVSPGDLVLMRDPDKVLLSNYRDPWRSWERTKHMLWESLKPLYGAFPRRFRVDYDDWSVLEDWAGKKIPKSKERYSAGSQYEQPQDGWDWVDEYAKFYFEDIDKWPLQQS